MLAKLAGLSGQLRYGYQLAAELGRWTMKGEVVVANIASTNGFWFERRPLDLWLRVGRRHWIWCGVELSDDRSPAHIRVKGDPERRLCG